MRQNQALALGNGWKSLLNVNSITLKDRWIELFVPVFGVHVLQQNFASSIMKLEYEFKHTLLSAMHTGSIHCEKWKMVQCTMLWAVGCKWDNACCSEFCS